MKENEDPTMRSIWPCGTGRAQGGVYAESDSKELQAVYSSVEEDDSHPRAVEAKLIAELCTISRALPQAPATRMHTDTGI